MKFSTIVPVLALAGSALAAPATTTTPAPTDVYIKTIQYNGSGCPISPPSASVVISDDKESFTVLFSSFVAQAGPGIARTENRKNCQLNIGLHIPSGFQVSIASVDFRGWAQLDSKVNGLQTSNYYFQGDHQTVSTQCPLSGPMTDDYEVSKQVTFGSLSWSPCGEDSNININTSIFVDNSKATKSSGLLTTDSVDGKVTQIYGFTWQKCGN
ncbi:hypothetical protein HKX48_009324 [Thoreauomyces humboldtii]|nr:hypothetical protein HKX48_009324 [Thoreauomyces humboldtii]